MLLLFHIPLQVVRRFSGGSKVIDVHGMKCREVKFTQNDNTDAVYYQVYCQDSKDLLISFDPKNDFLPEELLPKDKICVHCQK